MMAASRWSLLMISALLLALTLALMFDDLILYLVFERLLAWQVSWPLKIMVGALLTVCNFALAVLIMKSLIRQPQTGAEGMIGAPGLVTGVGTSDYHVKIRGELWRAQSPERLEIGDKIVVRQVNGLTLDVARLNN